MKRFVIFGCGDLLSNIFDNIHANNGRVYKICLNMPEVKKERAIGLQERISLLGYDVKVQESLESFHPEKNCSYIVGIATPEKYKLVEMLKEKYSLKLTPLIHPTANLGSNVHIGEGVTIEIQAVIGPNVYLDDFCYNNRCSMIMHETRVGKYALVGSGVFIGGSTEVGEKCRIGARAIILEQVRIGDWTVVGAGALVNKDLPGHVVAYGLPAKVIRKNDRAN
jgi:sugar O-acyltransferase (sialic acid O-acetyltransferase NeuD family)